MREKIFKTYDIRGIYPEDINEKVVFEIASNLSKLFDSGKVVVSFDGRHGSSELAKKVEEGLIEGFGKSKKEIEIISTGLSTTPMFYFLVNHFKASGGVMITASHNPKEYNGLKIVGKRASMIGGLEVKEVVLN